MNADGDDPVARVAAVRTYLRSRSTGTTPMQTIRRLGYQVYVLALFGGVWGTAVASALSDPSRRAPIGATAATDLVPAVVVGIALVATVAGVRTGSWAGPVLVSRPEAAWLLPAPLERRALLRRHLGIGLAIFGAAGAALGLVIAVVVGVETGGGLAAPAVGTTLAWAALGVGSGAAALTVESSPRLARRALRGTTLLAVAGVGLVALTVVRPVLAAWATPWGWASVPILSTLGIDVGPVWLAPLLLVVVAVVAVVAVDRALPDLPDEELVRRAGTAQGIRSSAFVFDARAIAQARRSGQAALVGHRRIRLPLPGHRWLLVPWRDAVSLARRRGALERTVVAAAVSAALLVWAGSGLGAIVVAIVVASAGVGQLLEPFRVELEEPVLEELTPLLVRDIALEHLVVPFTVLATSGALVLVGTALLGVVPAGALGAGLIATTAVAALLTAAAGLTSTRGAPPLHWLMQGEYSALLLAGWILAGPLLAVVVVLPPVLAAMAGLHAGLPALAAVGTPAVGAVALAGGLVATTKWRVAKRLAPE